MRHAMLSSNAVSMPVNRSSYTITPSAPRATSSSKAWWIYPLTDPRPLWQLMNPLPIPLLLPIKHGIFVLRSHLRLRWHLLFPPLQLGCRLHVVLLEGIVDGRYNIVDETEAFALTALLGGGETPGYFPEETSRERGACPKSSEHDFTVVVMK